jgi:hypothetical protein
MRDIKQIFDFMNDVDFPYLVLRNWDGLPYSAELGEHSDLDLLVYDISHWIELFPKAQRVYPAPRVQFKLPVDNSFVQIDVRYLGDGYYPLNFQKVLLDTKVWNENGFYTPSEKMFNVALAYHAVHHKNKNTYPIYLGDSTVEELLGALKDSTIGWVEPLDPSVGRFNGYMKGATSTIDKGDGVVTKKQNDYREYDLIGNEARILKKVDSIHFPKVIKDTEDEIVMEDCGEQLTAENLPDNWREQLIEIVKDLRKFGIQHRDIKPDNLMVKGGIVKLIDFGWARHENDMPDSPPSCLGYPYRASWGSDDNFSMKIIIKMFNYQTSQLEGVR